MVEDADARSLTLADYFTDPDIATNGDVLTYRVVTNSNASLIEPTFASGQMVLKPKADQNGTATILVEARDGLGRTVTNTLVVQVTPVADAPRLVNPMPDRSVAEDSAPIVIELSPGVFFDPDVINGDTLTFFAVSSNTNVANVSVLGSTMQITLVPNAFGQTTISVEARDGSGSVVSDSFVLTVTPVNDDPVARPDTYSAPQGEIFRTTDPTGASTPAANDNGVLANDTDIDGDSLTAELRANATRGTVVLNSNGTFTYTPGPTAIAGTTDTFRYRVRDAFGGVSSETTVTINIGQPLPPRYQNPGNKFDVNADGFVSPIDVLIVINLLNTRGPSVPVQGLPGPPDYVDVNGNNTVEPLDALEVINFINSGRGSGEGEGEGYSDRMSNGLIQGWTWTYDIGGRVPNALSLQSEARALVESHGNSSRGLANAAQPLGATVPPSTNMSLAAYLESLVDEEQELVDQAVGIGSAAEDRNAIDQAIFDLFDE
jgi:hypothetical protein